jgi:uncharacterized membrane protein
MNMTKVSIGIANGEDVNLWIFMRIIKGWQMTQENSMVVSIPATTTSFFFVVC